MGTEDIDYAAVVFLIEDNWAAFVECSGGEESAERSLQALKTEAGIS
jgi:hypothetical protein